MKLKTDHNSTKLLTQEAEYRAPYVDIITPILRLITQQCKENWIRFGGGYTKLNTAWAKQRKLATHIYTLYDKTRNKPERFGDWQEKCSLSTLLCWANNLFKEKKLTSK